jgi:uracil-DNA glycosylase family 4
MAHANTVAEYLDILQELRLTPVWRLRARYRVGEAPAASAANESPPVSAWVDAAPAVTRSEARERAARPDADERSARTDAEARVVRIAMLDWTNFAADVAACTACGLARTRNLTVPGVGDARADWLFIGEAPGAEEDAKGEPFVGQAGRLLDSMLAALGMNRAKAVYIANVLKCRPPNNRAPTPDEVESCLPYLDRQIALIQPKLIVALGKSAATTLLGSESSIASLRGRVHRYKSTPLVVTYHPAYLLRTLPDKAKAWEDLCFARATLRGLLDAGALQTGGQPPT